VLGRIQGLLDAVDETFSEQSKIPIATNSVVLDLEPLLDMMSGAIVAQLMFGHGFDDGVTI
jgi:hypothetical protein